MKKETYICLAFQFQIKLSDSLIRKCHVIGAGAYQYENSSKVLYWLRVSNLGFQ
jgi:hypothetical protein